jgi:predicted NAD/FAD-binding protein
VPFEFSFARPKKIAVIGAGISGMGAAHLLAKSNRVTLFEADKRLGGHARTVVAGKNQDQPVDTGFIVFNYANYPRMTKLFETLDVPVMKSDMSFGVSAQSGNLEYALRSLNSLYGQRLNLIRPQYHRMISDILKFNKNAENALEGPEMSLRDLLAKLGTGDWFRDHYILPFSGAIWSTSLAQMLDFPAQALINFFKNHNLLSTGGHHQWYTVNGGSIQYVNLLEQDMKLRGVDIRLNSPVQGVRRTVSGVEIRAQNGDWESFDTVVMASHSDQSLRMLEDPTHDEKRLLSAIKYQPNKAILHSDPVVMPKRKRCWSSWVHVSDKNEANKPVGVSYWMNRLQSLPETEHFFQSLNPTKEIKQELIHDEKMFMHPVFDSKALSAQEELQNLQGHNNTWYCGAWMRNGFHEDGYSSAVDVVESMGAIAAWA